MFVLKFKRTKIINAKMNFKISKNKFLKLKILVKIFKTYTWYTRIVKHHKTKKKYKFSENNDFFFLSNNKHFILK